MPFAHLSSFMLHELVLDNKFVKYYVGTARENASFFTPQEQEMVMNNIAYYTFIIFCSLGIEDKRSFTIFIEPLHFDLPSTVREAIQGYLLTLRDAIIVTLSDDTKNVEFVNEVANMYLECLQFLTLQQEQQVAEIESYMSGGSSRRIYAKFPSYWSKTTRRRACVSGLMSMASTLLISQHIESLCVPKIAAFKHDIPPQIRVSGSLLLETFVILGQCLPRNVVLGKFDTNYLEQFKNYVWNTNNTPMPKMQQHGISGRAIADIYSHYGKLYLENNDQEITMQIFCYHLPGDNTWWRIWMMKHYPQTNEIRRRLLFLKTVEKWRIPDRDIARMFMQQIA